MATLTARTPATKMQISKFDQPAREKPQSGPISANISRQLSVPGSPHL